MEQTTRIEQGFPADTDKELVIRKFVEREEGIEHPTYDTELAFYQMVSDGKVEELKRTIQSDEIDKEARGILSKNRIRNMKYHIIVTIVMISRMCIEKGMEEIESYYLSDYYIRLLDEENDVENLKKIHRKMVFDYAGRMAKVQKKPIISVHCVKAVDYIKNHLHEPIYLEDVAKAVKLEKTYFCKLFHKEMGMTMKEYILQQKLKAMKNMLEYSEYSCGEIAQFLAFPSVSYMGMKCKEQTGKTPTEYRKEKYRKHFIKE